MSNHDIEGYGIMKLPDRRLPGESGGGVQLMISQEYIYRTYGEGIG